MENALNLPPMKSRKPLFPKLSPNLLKRLSKSVLAIALSVCLVFGYSYKQPVKAEAAVTTVAICGAALVATTLIALGIGCSQALPTPEYNRTCQNIYNGMQTAVTDGAIALSMVGKDAYYHLSNNFIGACLNGIRAAYPDVDLSNVQSSYELADSLGWDRTNLTPVDLASWAGKDKLNPLQGYKSCKLQQMFNMPKTTGDMIQIIGLSITLTDSNPSSVAYYKVSNKVPYALLYAEHPFDDGYQHMASQIALISAVSAATGHACYFILESTGNRSYLYDTDAAAQTGNLPDVYNPANKDIFADGYSALNHKVDDVINKVGALQGIADGIRVRIGDVVGSIDQVNDQIRSRTQTQVTDVDASDDATEAENDKTNTGRDTTLPKNPSMPDLKLPTGIQRKFPFCLPWDLAACYRLFQVTPKAPTWNIPIKINMGMVHVDKTYTYDLNSMGVLDQALPVFKWFEDLLFVLGLILITRKIMS